MHFFQEIIEGGGAPPLAPKSSVTVVSTSSTTVPSGLVRYPTLLGAKPLKPQKFPREFESSSLRTNSIVSEANVQRPPIKKGRRKNHLPVNHKTKKKST